LQHKPPYNPPIQAGLLHRVPFDLPEHDFQVVRHVARCRSRAADELLSMVTAPFARITSIVAPCTNRIRPAKRFRSAKSCL